MKKLAFFVLVLAPILLSNCDCLCVDRDFGTMKVKLTLNDENPSADITVFRGKWENGDTLFTDNVKNNRVTYRDLEPEQYYSAVIVYKKGSREITAIDGRYLELKENEDCDCYRAETIHLNLKLAD